MPNPIRYVSDLEKPIEDEGDIHAGMIEQFAKIQGITFKDYGRAVRGVHAKGHGLLRGRIEVLADLPKVIAQRSFAQPRTHDVPRRFSTNPATS